MARRGAVVRRNRLGGVSEELSAAEEAAATGARSEGAWGSVLACQEFAAVRSAGFAPVGQVFGAAVYAAAAASGSSCPGAAGALGGQMPAPTADHVPGRGDPGGFGPLVEAMYQARRAAVDRMTAECAALGGHGVVGVRLERGPFTLGGLEFTAIGTAVRAVSAAARLRVPFTSAVSGQDFARLVMAGWVPAGLALGVSIAARHDDWVTVGQTRWGAGNTEVTGYTQLVNDARHDARRQLEADVKRLGGEGVVIATMEMRVRERECPVQEGRRDHIIEATNIGTAIARFSLKAERAGAPSLAILSLDPQRRQAARVRL